MSFRGKQYRAYTSGGMGNKDAFAQFSDTDPHTLNFYAFTPVNGNATFTELLEEEASVGATKLAYTYYEGQLYSGAFTGFTLSSGTILLYKEK